MKTFLRLVTSLALASAALVAGPVACSDSEGSGTTGRRVALDVQIAASPASKQFTNAKGWTISLTKAAVSTGAFYFYDGAPLFAAGGQPRTRGFVRAAFAHPGHYVAGNARGEMLSPSSADLLAGAVLGSGDGVTGMVRSATFAFSTPATGPMAAELGASVVVLEGTATKDAETRVFRAEIAADEMKDGTGDLAIEGCPFESADMQSDGTVTITIDLPMWLQQVDLTEVPASTDGKPVLLTTGVARNQLVRGAKGGLSYRFAYAPR
jgi:hypothetical protein